MNSCFFSGHTDHPVKVLTAAFLCFFISTTAITQSTYEASLIDSDSLKDALGHLLTQILKQPE